MYGMTGKILRVNLSNSKISTLSSEPYVEHYLGGRGVASRIYWEEVPPEVKPFDPENKLIFVNGSLVGTGAQAATVMAVAGKSPCAFPEGYCYGFFAGYVGTELKKAGYDGIIVEGCATEPVYIWINDNKVEIRKASSMWGKSTYSAAELIKKEHGESAKYITIGVSGEKKVRTAIALASHESTLSCGFAAVMGSKNLKAIVIKGSGTIFVASPDKLKELNRYSYSISKRVHLSIPPQILHSGPGHLLEVVGKGNCYKCGSVCIRNVYRYGKRDDLVAMRRCQSIEYYLPWFYGKDDEPIETLFNVPILANDYAIESFELESMIKWLYACHQAGCLSDKETGLPLSKIGTMGFLKKWLHAIAYREGFGDILAEGQLRAGEKISAQARALFSHQVTAIGQYETTPTRAFVYQSLLIPMEPRAHQPLLHANIFVFEGWIANLMHPDQSPIDTKVYHEVAKAFWGGEAAGNVSSYEGKPLAAVKIQNRVYLHDSLGLCNFTWPIDYSFSTPNHVGDPDLEGKLFSAVTGLDAGKLDEYSKNIVDLQRAILIREGRKLPESDYPKEYLFTEPIIENHPIMVPGPSGPIDVTGNKLDKQKYTSMLHEFYKLRNWNPKTGMPNNKIPKIKK
jgi:aldehyde:ferredoxin oxidoreductase